MDSGIIAVINQKGGTGKTTLALNLAAGLARRASTCLVDGDPQRSVTQWGGLGGGKSANFGVTSLVEAESDIANVLAKVADKYHFVVVDCPPLLKGPIVDVVLRCARRVLIPVLPSPVDLWASVDMVSLINGAKKFNTTLSAGLLLNQMETRNALSHVLREAVAEFEIPVLAACMQRRAAYRSAAVEGVSVYEMGKRGQLAVADIEAIIKEVLCL